MPTNAPPNYHEASYALFVLQSYYVYEKTHSTQVDRVTGTPPPASTPHYHLDHSQSLLLRSSSFSMIMLLRLQQRHDVRNSIIVLSPTRFPHHGKPRLAESDALSMLFYEKFSHRTLECLQIIGHNPQVATTNVSMNYLSTMPLILSLMFPSSYTIKLKIRASSLDSHHIAQRIGLECYPCCHLTEPSTMSIEHENNTI